MYFNNEWRKKIIDHYQKPKYKYLIDEKEVISYEQESKNCADKILLQVKISHNVIKKISFTGYGCTISIATADIFCQELENKSLLVASNIINNFIAMIDNKEYNDKCLNDLIVFYNLKDHQIRKKCALLSASAFKTIINNALSKIYE